MSLFIFSGTSAGNARYSHIALNSNEMQLRCVMGNAANDSLLAALQRIY